MPNLCQKSSVAEAMTKEGQMAVSKTKGSISKFIQAKPDEVENESARAMQVAAQALIRCIIEAGDSVQQSVKLR